MKTTFKIKIPHFVHFYQHLKILNVACNIYLPFFSFELVAHSFLHRKRSYYFFLRRAHPWSSLEIRRYPADRSRGTDDGTGCSPSRNSENIHSKRQRRKMRGYCIDGYTYISFTRLEIVNRKGKVIKDWRRPWHNNRELNLRLRFYHSILLS